MKKGIISFLLANDYKGIIGTSFIVAAVIAYISTLVIYYNFIYNFNFAHPLIDVSWSIGLFLILLTTIRLIFIYLEIFKN